MSLHILFARLLCMFIDYASAWSQLAATHHWSFGLFIDYFSACSISASSATWPPWDNPEDGKLATTKPISIIRSSAEDRLVLRLWWGEATSSSRETSLCSHSADYCVNLSTATATGLWAWSQTMTWWLFLDHQNSSQNSPLLHIQETSSILGYSCGWISQWLRGLSRELCASFYRSLNHQWCSLFKWSQHQRFFTHH